MNNKFKMGDVVTVAGTDGEWVIELTWNGRAPLYDVSQCQPDGFTAHMKYLRESMLTRTPALPPEVEDTALGVLKGAKITVDGKDYTVSGYAAIPIEPPPPALPPEPPVGTIGYVDDEPAVRKDHTQVGWSVDGFWRSWADIADRFVPAIPNDGSYVKRADVEAWLRYTAAAAPSAAGVFRAKFGGAKRRSESSPDY